MTTSRPSSDELCDAIKMYDRDLDTSHVKALLEQGADPNALNAIGVMPLMLAVTRSVALVQMLIEHGADVNAKTSLNQVPVVACVIGSATPAYEETCFDILQFLISQGAVLDYADHNGKTPLLWAEAMGNTKAVEILKKALKTSEEIRKKAIKVSELHNTAVHRQNSLKNHRRPGITIKP